MCSGAEDDGDSMQKCVAGVDEMPISGRKNRSCGMTLLPILSSAPKAGLQIRIGGGGGGAGGSLLEENLVRGGLVSSVSMLPDG